ncbi:MAG: radical SAM protein [Candidatus Orphnella occulta]|nr:radical SAM protein [Candidatus Orphnella occulta]
MNILFVVKDINLEHLGIMHISSFLKDRGHRVEAIAANYSDIKKKIKSGSFKVIAYSVSTLLLDFYISLNARIKNEFDVFSIFGGPHPTLIPEIIYNNSHIDCICRGEGELVMLELAEKMSRNEPIFNIKNLWVKENNRVFKNPLRPLIQDLDSLPFPDRQLFTDTGISDQGKINVITSRGCQYECSYCAQPAYNRLYSDSERRVRRRSPQDVINEIMEVKKVIRPTFIKFEDDLFISSFKWIDEFCRLYRQDVNVPFFCYVRPEHVTSKIVKILKKAGCHTMSMGIETADGYLRTTVLKRTTSKDDIVAAAHTIKREGLVLEGLNMVGIPRGSLESDIETLKLNIQCNVDYSNTKLFMPYPGTAIYDFVCQQGLLADTPFFSFWTSSLKFSTAREKRATENLHKLFALTVGFPFLLPIVKKVIYFPLGRLYIMINLAWEGCVAFFRLYPTGRRGVCRGVVKYMSIFKNNVA